MDIAEKALSPGINDPTTACQALNVLHDLLRRLAVRPAPSDRHTDAEGRVRLVVPQYTFQDYLDLSVREIWEYGQTSSQVSGRLVTMLDDLDGAARPEYRGSIIRWRDVVNTSGS